MVNRSAAPVRFRIAGAPGQPVERYDVPPGEACEVPEGYVRSGLIARIAPGLERDLEPRAPPPPAEPAPESEPKPTSSEVIAKARRHKRGGGRR